MNFYTIQRPLQWRISQLEHSTRMQKVGCSNPNLDRPNLLKHCSFRLKFEAHHGVMVTFPMIEKFSNKQTKTNKQTNTRQRVRIRKWLKSNAKVTCITCIFIWPGRTWQLPLRVILQYIYLNRKTFMSYIYHYVSKRGVHKSCLWKLHVYLIFKNGEGSMIDLDCALDLS